MVKQYQVELQDDEKVIFTTMLSMFGTETDRFLGGGSRFILTNKRIIIDTGLRTYTANLDEIVSCTKVERGKFIFKNVYFAVDLNTEILFDNGKQKLSGFHFYFNKKDTPQFESIMNNILAERQNK